MRMIKRIEIDNVKVQEIELWASAQILSVGYRDGALCIWVMGDPLIIFPYRTRTLRIAETEDYLPDREFKFLGTVTQNQFEYHIFLEMEE